VFLDSSTITTPRSVRVRGRRRVPCRIAPAGKAKTSPFAPGFRCFSGLQDGLRPSASREEGMVAKHVVQLSEPRRAIGKASAWNWLKACCTCVEFSFMDALFASVRKRSSPPRCGKPIGSTTILAPSLEMTAPEKYVPERSITFPGHKVFRRGTSRAAARRHWRVSHEQPCLYRD